MHGRCRPGFRVSVDPHGTINKTPCPGAARVQRLGFQKERNHDKGKLGGEGGKGVPWAVDSVKSLLALRSVARSPATWMDGSLSRAPPVGWPCPAAAAAGARWVGNLNSRPGRAAPLRPGWSQVSGRLSLAARRCGWVTGNSASVWMCEIDGLVCLGACAWVAEQMLIVAALVVDR